MMLLVAAFFWVAPAAGGCVWLDAAGWGSRYEAQAPLLDRLWTRQLPRATRFRGTVAYVGSLPRALPGEFSVPLVAEGRVFVGTSAGVVVALDLETGKFLWQSQVSPDPISCQPALAAGDVVVVGGEEGAAVALAAESGDIRWRTLLEAPIRGRIVSDEGWVFVEDARGGLWVLAADSGKKIWDVRGAEPAEMIARAFGGPVLGPRGERVFWARWDGMVLAAEVATGRLLWQENYGGGPHERFRDTDLGLAIDAEHLYLARFGGPTLKLRLSDGIALWRSEPDGGAAASGPAAGDGRVYVPLVGGGVAGLDTSVGGRLKGWGEEIDAEWGVASRPSWLGPWLVLITSEGDAWNTLSGSLIAIGSDRGQVLWRSKMLDGGFAGVFAGGGVVAALSDRAILQAWKLREPAAGSAPVDESAEPSEPVAPPGDEQRGSPP